MGWLGRIGIVLLVLIVVAGGVYWYLLADGEAPATSSYKTDIAAWRALVANDTAELPNEIRVEVVGRDSIPFGIAQAGGGYKPYVMARTAFQLNGPEGSVIIDSGMDQEIAAATQRENPVYDEAAYGRVIVAMGNAARVVVTHEHPDHIAGVARFPVPERLAERLTLTVAQFEGLRLFAPGGVVSPALATAQLIDPKEPVRVAAGVVMIPAPGHTAGNVMFYAKLADGREVLFLGDVAWALSNVRAPAVRPRLVQEYLMSPPEDRAKVGEQIRALHDLYLAEEGLIMIPSHDNEHLATLIADGLVKEQFSIEAP
jgi:glyoxylase-like metal-dependent hydrolase (beta-lactamase superfamily II)